MTFISFTDQWQVLIDDQGNPLIGRLQFLDYATSQPKNVYTDIDLTIAAENPQYTDITGKLENQIFLGTGDYKVRFERYIGSGDMKDTVNAEDDSLWVAFKTETISGIAAADSVLGENVLVINTIAELRSVNPDNYTTVTVLGYYSRFDNIAARTYVWSENDSRADNFGSIIQRTGQNVGRWNLLEPEEMDSRYFGIFPSAVSTYNSQLTALISWLTSQYCTCKSIRFSTGTYSFIAGTFTFLKKLILEPDVKFAIIGEGSLNININGDYDIQTVSPLITNAAALANVIISFNGSKNAVNRAVKSEWYGNWADATNGDSESLIAMSSRVGRHYLMQFGSTYYMTSGTATFYQDIEFIAGSITLKGGSVIFTNNEITSPETTATRLTTATGGAYSDFVFSGVAGLRSSLFSSVAFQIALNGIQTNSTASRLIFDSDVVFTAAFTDNDNFTYSYEKGLITTQTQDAYAKFNSLVLPTKQVFGYNSWVGLRNQDTKIVYFLPSDPSQSEEQHAFYSTLRCALNGNGVADMCGTSIETETVATTTRLTVADSIDLLEIKNGVVIASEAITLIDLYRAVIQVRLKDFTVYDNSQSTGCTLLAVNAGSAITNLILNNVTVFGSNDVGETIRAINGGVIRNVEVTNSYIRSGWLINETTVNNDGIRYVNIHNNRLLQCSFRARNAKPVINSNYIQGNDASSFWEVKCIFSAMITGNAFFNCDLYLLDNGAGIDHNVTGNQFYSDNTKASRIIIKAETANTKVLGLNIVGNSWTGSISANTLMLYADGSFSDLYDYEDNGSIRTIYQSKHRCTIKNNTADDYHMILPATEGVIQLNALTDSENVATSTYIDIDGYKRITWLMTLRPEIFYIPGSVYSIKGDIEFCADQAGTTSQDSSTNYQARGLGIDPAYRSDGKMFFSHTTTAPGVSPRKVNLTFNIYDKSKVIESI